jgi:hypothetical protein
VSRAPRNAPSQTDQVEAVDPFENPGSYRRNTDGSYTRLDEATKPPEAAPAPVLPPASAEAIAQALAAIGHEPPAYLGVDPAPGSDLTLITELPASSADGDA